MNLNIIRGKMAERALTQRETAKRIGLSLSRFNAKLNGKADFTVKEIRGLKQELDLSPDQIDTIFFEQEVS